MRSGKEIVTLETREKEDLITEFAALFLSGVFLAGVRAGKGVMLGSAKALLLFAFSVVLLVKAPDGLLVLLVLPNRPPVEAVEPVLPKRPPVVVAGLFPNNPPVAGVVVLGLPNKPPVAGAVALVLPNKPPVVAGLLPNKPPAVGSGCVATISKH